MNPNHFILLQTLGSPNLNLAIENCVLNCDWIKQHEVNGNFPLNLRHLNFLLF